MLSRPRLEQRLDEAFGKRLTTVVAGAGYGKSTLLSQWTEDIAAAWFTASPSDELLSTFAAGLTQALGKLVEEGEPPRITSAGETDISRAESLGAAMSEWLQPQLDNDAMLIVDDAHAASLGTVLASARGEPLPSGTCPSSTSYCATREPLTLRTERLRAQGALLELTGAELAFTPDEVAALVGTTLGEDEALAGDLHALTRGWPAAVRLALEALKPLDTTEREASLASLRQPGSPLLSYLAEEVFEREAQTSRLPVTATVWSPRSFSEPQSISLSRMPPQIRRLRSVSSSSKKIESGSLRHLMMSSMKMAPAYEDALPSTKYVLPGMW